MSDERDAKRRQHGITTKMYAELDACQPDRRDMISDYLGWIGDADEVQRLEDEGHLEGMVNANLYAEDSHDPERDKDESNIDLVHDGGRKALEVYREWKAKTAKPTPSADTVLYSVAAKEYLETQPYGPVKTMRDCELSLQQFREHVGDQPLQDVTAVMIHGYAEHLGQTMARKTVAKKISYVKRMYDHAVRKGWVLHNIFAGLVMDKKVGTPRQSYIPLTPDELTKLFEQEMPDHSRRLLSILITSGMRIDEAALLDWEDIKEDQGIVYYDLTNAIVKNKGSQRRVPVHSSLSWITPGKTGQMFPQFTRDKDGKAQASASKALMPLIRNVTEAHGPD